MIVTHGGHVNRFTNKNLQGEGVYTQMWFLALLPLLAAHSAAHHMVMNAYVPFYQAFDIKTKHVWTSRATALLVQAVLLPAAAIWGRVDAGLHVLGMYILSDCIHLITYDHDPMTWAHHTLAFLSYLGTFFVSAHLVRTMLIATLILEWTSPWIQICWFANKAGLASRPWFYPLSGFTLINYFIVRCIGFPYFVFTYTPKFMWIVGSLFSILNWIWMFELVGYARAVHRKAQIE
jgi:hypothetical protein